MQKLAAFLVLFAGLNAFAQVDASLSRQVSDLLQPLDRIQSNPESVRAGVAIFHKKLEGVRLGDFKKSQFNGALAYLVPEVFKRRLQLRQTLVELNAQGQLTAEVARDVHQAMRYLRGIEDYVGYVDTPREVLPPSGQKKILTIFGDPGESLLPAEQTLLNPDFLRQAQLRPGELALRSGDVLLSRGSAATSSAIARLGNQDTQFSHMALVYVDPATGQAQVIEAHIELGVTATPIEQWFADGKKRTAVFRYQDADVSKRAGEMMYAYITDYQKKHGKNIEYDFGFDMNDDSRIFCSEVTRKGYALATGGQVQVPAFPNDLTPTHRDFLDQLGIRETQSFIPADIEIDPRFQLVAEWRNFKGIKESWLRDAITTKVHGWMESGGLRYQPPAMMKAAGRALVALRHSPCEGLVNKRVAPNVTPDVVAVMLTIESMYGKVMKQLLKREASVLAARGTPFTLFEALYELEYLRKFQPKLFKVLQPAK